MTRSYLELDTCQFVTVLVIARGTFASSCEAAQQQDDAGRNAGLRLAPSFAVLALDSA